MSHSAAILNEIHEAFTRYINGNIINLDEKLRQKFPLLVFKLENHKNLLDIPPHRTSHFCIRLVVKGSGESKIGNFNFPIRKNTLCFVSSRVAHSSQLSKNATGFCLNFGIDFFLQQSFPRHHALDRIIFTSSVSPCFYLTDQQAKKLIPVFECIYKEFNTYHKGKDILIAVKIIELLIYMDRILLHEIALEKERLHHSTVQQFEKLVEKNFAKEHSVGFYANLLNIHPNYLNNLVKRSTGITAKQVIQDRILVESKFLLHSTDLSVKEIAYELGFGDPYSFYRFFSNAEQRSPLTYRKQAV